MRRFKPKMWDGQESPAVKLRLQTGSFGANISVRKQGPKHALKVSSKMYREPVEKSKDFGDVTLSTKKLSCCILNQLNVRGPLTNPRKKGTLLYLGPMPFAPF